MSMVRNTFIALFMLLLVSGCVTSKVYRAKADEAASLHDRVSALEGEFAAEQKLHQEDVARLNNNIDTLNDKNDKLTAANTELESQMEASRLQLVKEITDLKQQITAAGLQNKDLMDRLKDLEAKNADLTSQLEAVKLEKERALAARRQDVSELQGTYNALVGELKDEIQKGKVEVSQLKDKLTLSMVDKILFDSGSAQVNKDGRAVLDRVAEILKKVTDKQVRIEGHTDNVAIGAALQDKFPTNWELSTARATNVVRYLQENDGLNPERLSAAGYAQYHPVASNDTEEGRAKNRRIEIVLVPLDVQPQTPPEEEVPGVTPGISQGTAPEAAPAATTEPKPEAAPVVNSSVTPPQAAPDAK